MDIICEKSTIDMQDIVLMWASPPCETYSRANWSNLSRGNNHREPDGKMSPAGDLAKSHDRLTQRIKQVLKLVTRSVMENPAGGMEKMWFMADMEDKKKILNLCAYAWPFRKTTNLWVNGFEFEPEGNTGDGKCNDECGQGAINPESNKFRHHMALAVHPERGPRGAGAAEMTCGMPRQLIMEVLKAVAATAQVSGKVVVDLCAGFQSMREAVEAAGAKYVAVDIQRLRKPPQHVQRQAAIVLVRDDEVLATENSTPDGIKFQYARGGSKDTPNSSLSAPVHEDAARALERATGLSENEWRTWIRRGPTTRALKGTTYYIYDINPSSFPRSEAESDGGKQQESYKWVRAGEVTTANGWRSEDVQVTGELDLRARTSNNNFIAKCKSKNQR